MTRLRQLGYTVDSTQVRIRVKIVGIHTRVLVEVYVCIQVWVHIEVNVKIKVNKLDKNSYLIRVEIYHTERGALSSFFLAIAKFSSKKAKICTSLNYSFF